MNYNLTNSINFETFQYIYSYHKEEGLKIIDNQYIFCLGNVTMRIEENSLGKFVSVMKGWHSDLHYFFMGANDVPDSKIDILNNDQAVGEGDYLVF